MYIKNENHQDITELKAMVKDFDPVSAYGQLEGNDKFKKLLTLMQGLKTALPKASTSEIANLNIASVIDESVSFEDFNISVVTASISDSSLKQQAENSAKVAKRVMQISKSIDKSLIDMSKFMVNISDGGLNIVDALHNAIKPEVSESNRTAIMEDNNISSIIEKVIKDGYSSSQISSITDYFIDASHNIEKLIQGDFAYVGFENPFDKNVFLDNPPVAIITTSDTNVTHGTNMTFDASNSYDTNGTIVAYEWREGNTILSTASSFSKDDFSAGTHHLTLTVTDNDGNVNSDELLITIVAEPIVVLAKPNIADAPAIIVTKGTAVPTTSFTNTGGAIASCTISPTLVSGLALANDCTITGTPTATQVATTHTVTATNASGNGTATVSITVNDVAAPVEKSEKNMADGYIIKLPSPAIAECPSSIITSPATYDDYNSSMSLGEKGLLTFEGVMKIVA